MQAVCGRTRLVAAPESGFNGDQSLYWPLTWC